MKIKFNDLEKNDIINLYINENLSTEKIGLKYGVSKTPINNLLKEEKLLRKSKSNGVKILLSELDKRTIKKLYLNGFDNCDKLAKELGYSPSFMDKYLSSVDYRRNKSEATSLSKLGVKLSDKAKINMTIAQQKLSKSGNRIQTGGICKFYMVNNLICQGTYEKFYIDFLTTNGLELPKNGNGILTPFGVYTPDFSFSDKLIEIKSEYTYDVLVGNKISRFTNKYETKQYNKIKWVNENIKKIEILVINKRNNKLIKKEI